MKADRETMLFIGLWSDTGKQIPRDIIDEMLDNIPEELDGAVGYVGKDLHIPYIAKDGNTYHFVFSTIKLWFYDEELEERQTVDVSELPYPQQ